MANEPLTIKVDPVRELAHALAGTVPVVLDSNGERSTVSRENIFAHNGPQRARAALCLSTGALKVMGTAGPKRALREQRTPDSQRRPAQVVAYRLMAMCSSIFCAAPGP